MEPVVVVESKLKNSLFAILSLIVAAGFLYGGLASSRIYLVVVGLLFLIGGLHLSYIAFSNRPVLIIDEEGIWSRSYKKKFEWADIASVGFENGMLVISLKDVNKYWPDPGWFTRMFLKAIVVPVDRTKPSRAELVRLFDERFGAKVGAPTKLT